MVQGKVEQLGLRWDFRMEEKALSASTESLLRANSAMIEFQEWILVMSTYLLNCVVMFAVLEKRRRRCNEHHVKVFIFSSVILVYL